MARSETPQRSLQPFNFESSPGAGPSTNIDDDDAGDENIFRDMTFEEVLEDLNARFLVNLPDEEMSLVRVYWQAEQAHWFYEDYLRPLNPLLPSLSQRQFTHLIIASSPLYANSEIDYDAVWEEYCAYKKMVPCCGGILLNSTGDKVLMVRGWKSNAGWCFPRGKINADEPEIDCAIREVEEETGFDLTGLINENDFIKTQINAQEVTMFIAKGIDESTVFETQTRKEIGAIEWVPFDDLPTWTHKKGPKRTGGKGQKKFYNVTPFVPDLKRWMTKHGMNPNPKRRQQQQQQQQYPPHGHQQYQQYAQPQAGGRELKPFAFDDGSAQAEPATALDHLFAKFIQKDDYVTNLQSDKTRSLDQLFGNLDVKSPGPSHKRELDPQERQRQDDQALERLLGNIGGPTPPAGPADPKQSHLLAMLNQPKQAAAPPKPAASSHQTNLLSMLSSPPSSQGPTPSHSARPSALDPAIAAVSPDDQRRDRQRALLESTLFGAAPAATSAPPSGARPGGYPAASVPPSSYSASNGTPSYPASSGAHSPYPPPGWQHQAQGPPPGFIPSPHQFSPQPPPQMQAAPVQYSQQQYPLSPPVPANPPANDHQRNLLGALFNKPGQPTAAHGNQQNPPGLARGAAPTQPPQYGQPSPQQIPFPPPMGHAGGPPPHFQNQYMPQGPPPGPHYQQPPQQQYQPQQGYAQQHYQPPPPQTQTAVQQAILGIPVQHGLPPPMGTLGYRPPPSGPVNAAPPPPLPQPQLSPGASVHQPVPRPPVGPGLLGLINGGR